LDLDVSTVAADLRLLSGNDAAERSRAFGLDAAVDLRIRRDAALPIEPVFHAELMLQALSLNALLLVAAVIRLFAAAQRCAAAR